MDQTGPVSLALWRYSIGSACLLLPAMLARRPRFDRRDLLPIALLGIGQFGVLVVLLNFALEYIPSARAALLFAMMPLLTLIVDTWRGSERIALSKGAGVVLTIVGVGLALSDKAFAPGDAANSWIGEGLALASALSGAICSVLYRPYLRRYPTIAVSAFAMLAAVAFLAVLAGGEGFFRTLPRFTTIGWSTVLFIGLSSAAGYFLWLWALRRTTATTVTAFLALSPVTAAALGALFLHEEVSSLLALGFGCVALGLWLAYRRERNDV